MWHANVIVEEYFFLQAVEDRKLSLECVQNKQHF